MNEFLENARDLKGWTQGGHFIAVQEHNAIQTSVDHIWSCFVDKLAGGHVQSERAGGEHNIRLDWNPNSPANDVRCPPEALDYREVLAGQCY